MDPEVWEMAQAIVEAKRKQREAREAQESKPRLTVGALWENEFAPWGKRTKKNWDSIQHVHWIALKPFWAHIYVDEVTLDTSDVYHEFRSKQLAKNTNTPIATGTRNNELQSLRGCFNWARKRKKIPYNPLSGLEKEDEGPKKRVFLDEPKFAQLIGVKIPPVFRLMCIVAYDTGMRQGELRELDWDRVDLETKVIRLGDGDVKNGTGRIVPLSDRAIAALNECPRWSRYVFTVHGGIIPRSTVIGWWRAARDRAGLPKKASFHCLRHSCATLMRRRGVPWPLIKAALGWKTDEMAHHYQQYNSEDWVQLREAQNAGILSDNRRPPLRAAPPKSDEEADTNTPVWDTRRRG